MSTLDPCRICDEDARHECECGRTACADHWDHATQVCKRCSNGPSEPDYDAPTLAEELERADRIQRELKR
jgi:hypothetical protein